MKFRCGFSKILLCLYKAEAGPEKSCLLPVSSAHVIPGAAAVNLWQGSDKLENHVLIDLTGPDIAQPLNCSQQSLTCTIGSYEKKKYPFLLKPCWDMVHFSASTSELIQLPLDSVMEVSLPFGLQIVH